MRVHLEKLIVECVAYIASMYAARAVFVFVCGRTNKVTTFTKTKSNASTLKTIFTFIFVYFCYVIAGSAIVTVVVVKQKSFWIYFKTKKKT